MALLFSHRILCDTPKNARAKNLIITPLSVASCIPDSKLYDRRTGREETAEARLLTLNKFMPLPSFHIMVVAKPVNFFV